MEIQYESVPGPLVPKDLLEECAELFSEHYGIWSETSQIRPGERIRLSPGKIRNLLVSKDTSIAYARHNGELIGYATALQSRLPRLGIVSWVTQLVVRTDFRRRGVGKTLLFSIWSFSDHYAWGLLSSNPYAVRALEKATRRRCDPVRISRSKKPLLRLGRNKVPYVTEKSAAHLTSKKSVVDTKFFVSHANVQQKLSEVTKDHPWLLGQLDDGYEWCAFTFKDQPQFSLSAAEIQAMVDANDQVTRQAYARMRIGDGHLWAKHAGAEAAWIMSNCGVKPGHRLLDVGCGAGRHVLEFAAHGIEAIGIDYVPKLIQTATNEAVQRGLENAAFHEGDARIVRLPGKFDLVVCVYDVIGSYVDEQSNRQIVETICYHLKPGGRALISVMNRHLTEARAKGTFSLSSDPDRLLNLSASNIMQASGDVFDPDYYLLDGETGIVYRKEQFSGDGSLPVELIVRDRRFYRDEITALCESANLRILWTRFVQAGRWDKELASDSSRAKEILVLCERT